MRTGLLAFGLVGLLACGGCRVPVQYKPLTMYTSTEGNFKVLFQGEPSWSTKSASFTLIHVAEAF